MATNAGNVEASRSLQTNQEKKFDVRCPIPQKAVAICVLIHRMHTIYTGTKTANPPGPLPRCYPCCQGADNLQEPDHHEAPTVPFLPHQ